MAICIALPCLLEYIQFWGPGQAGRHILSRSKEVLNVSFRRVISCLPMSLIVTVEIFL